MGLSLNKITKKYDTAVIDGLSFTFPDEGVICLLGKSGCGKTTLINCIAGIESLDGGEITGIEGKRISFVFQEDRLLPWISALNNVITVNGDEELCRGLLEKVGLGEDMNKFPVELSGGMRQRVAIARALAYGGDIFILDEPFKGLDVKTKSGIMGLVREYVKGKLCIFITHDLEEARLLSDSIIVADGPPFRVAEVIENGKYDKDKLTEILKETT